MTRGPRPRLTVDLLAVAENWRGIAALAPGAECAAVLKADAYGLGADDVAPALLRAGAGTFFVSTMDEATDIRRTLGAGPVIYILNGVAGVELDEAAASGLRPTLCTPEQAAEADVWTARANAALPCAIHADTGMNRLGLAPEEMPATLERLATNPALEVHLILSHLAAADELENPVTEIQAERFTEAGDRLRRIRPKARRSLAATAGILRGQHLAFDMVRPGIGLYGGMPYADARPVVRLETPILQVRTIAEGEPVGYNGTWRASRPCRIATVPLGYADGVSRSLSSIGSAQIGNRRANFAGRVNMDMITLDVTDIPEAAPGRMVELIGRENDVNAIATATGTIANEVLTSLQGRFERVYLPDDRSGAVAP